MIGGATDEAPAVHHGDCLALLERLPPRPCHLIYVDPPFNTGIAHRGRRGKGARAAGEAEYDDRWRGIEGFLAMLEPRLRALGPWLAPGASLWVQLDHRAVHETKLLLDGLHGRDAFAGEVIWVPGNGARARAGPSVTHQTLLIYAPRGPMRWNADDPALREPHASGSLRAHFSRVDADGRHYRERTVGGRTYRYYADEGRRRGSVWADCPAMAANTPLSEEATGYPTQKPLTLLTRIVRACTAPGDRVLDPMCGSGTALVAAVALGRLALGMDVGARAVALTRARLEAKGSTRAPAAEGDAGLPGNERGA